MKKFSVGCKSCNMPFLMPREGHEMANKSALGGWSEILMGFNTF